MSSRTPSEDITVSNALDDNPPEMVDLDWELREDGRVKVTGPDKHTMVLPIEAAIQACRALKDQILFGDQFDLLLDHLAEWVQQRQPDLKAAYLTVCDTGLLFVAVRNTRQYDTAFEDELTELDLEIANDTAYDLIRFDVQGLPDVPQESVRSFLSAKTTLRYPVNG